MKKEDDFCDGCCYRRTCDHDLEKCCYLVRRECLINQQQNYSFINCKK